MLVFLIGFMGSGKSTVGEKLAKKMGYAFADIDQLIETKTNLTIPALFETHGEAFFRETEKEILHTTFSLKNTVVSCGGGTPCFFDNMQQMRANGLTVYLKLTAGSLFHRLAPGKTKRPLIAAMPDLQLMEFIMNELHKREVFYETADLVVKGENLKTDELAGLIIASLPPSDRG